MCSLPIQVSAFTQNLAVQAVRLHREAASCATAAVLPAVRFAGCRHTWDPTCPDKPASWLHAHVGQASQLQAHVGQASQRFQHATSKVLLPDAQWAATYRHPAGQGFSGSLAMREARRKAADTLYAQASTVTAAARGLKQSCVHRAQPAQVKPLSCALKS